MARLPARLAIRFDAGLTFRGMDYIIALGQKPVE
jgi:hypothetical protein